MKHKLTKEVLAKNEKELSEWLQANLPVPQIADIAAELIRFEQEHSNQSPIVVDRDEFERLFSMFKIRGMREVDGEYVEETRGRRPKKG